MWEVWSRNFAEGTLRGKDRSYVQSHYICNIIKGTTFSGHPTKTTLGNTFRSICYALFYLYLAGIQKPWKSDLVDMLVSGDDVVILIDPRYVARVENVILQLTSRVKGTPT